MDHSPITKNKKRKNVKNVINVINVINVNVINAKTITPRPYNNMQIPLPTIMLHYLHHAFILS